MKQQKDQNVFYRCDFLQKMKPEFVEKKPTEFRNVCSLYPMRTDVSSRKYKNFLLFEIYKEKTFKICNKETISNIRVRRMLLSCPAKKVTKECGQRGATKMRPLWYPPPHFHPIPENVPIFGHLCRKNLKHFSMSAFKNRNIFGRWLAMRRKGFLRVVLRAANLQYP